MLESEEKKWSAIAAKIHHEYNEGEEGEMPSDDSFQLQYEKAREIHDILINNPIEINKNETWSKIEHGIYRYRLRTVRSFFKYAAIFIIALSLGYLFASFPVAEDEVYYCEVSVPYGQMSQVVLSDGTKVWLNSGSHLKYPGTFNSKQRSVVLEGEAFFDVSHMPDKPFFVLTEHLQVEVLGTSFNISAYKDELNTTVALVEGKVSVNNLSGDKIAQLRPNQIFAQERGEMDYTLTDDVDTDFYDSWKNGVIYFNNQTMEQISAKLERWYNIEIVFSDPTLKNYRFTGTLLKNKPVDQIMQVLELLLFIKYERKINIEDKDQFFLYKP